MQPNPMLTTGSLRLSRLMVACLAAGLGLGLALSMAGEKPKEKPAEEASIARGLTLLDSGEYRKAAEIFESIAENSRTPAKATNRVSALIALGTALQMQGQLCSAAQCLEEALPLATKVSDPVILMQAEAALGNVYLYSRRLDAAENLLRLAVAQARDLKQRRAEATILQSLASVVIAKASPPAGSYQKDARGVILVVPPTAAKPAAYLEGLELYSRSAEIAGELGDGSLRLKILANQARELLLHGEPARARAVCQEAAPLLDKLSVPREQAFVRLTFGNLAAQLGEQLPGERSALLQEASTAYQLSLRAGEELNDLRLQTYACGSLGELSFTAGRLDEAMQFAQRALFLAQKSSNEEASFQWMWLAARILRAQGDKDRALTAYRAAVRALDSLRSDFSLWLSVRGTRQSFRDSYGRVYFELADLLLERAAQGGTAEQVRDELLEARSTVELLKSVEVEDYFFEDDCASLFRTKVQTVENAAPQCAVVYFIPLTNRTELLVSLPSGLQRLSSPVGRAELNAEVRRWRSLLERPDSEDFKTPAKKLYDWLLQPLQEALRHESVRTLIFVPDGALRTVPMAALYDGQKFLVERYALAVSPGLSLMQSAPQPRRQMNVLLCGLSESVQGFPALEFVPAELRNIGTNFSHRTLLDTAFSTAGFEREMQQGQFTAIHLASHGEFGSDVSKTFILTHDGKLTLENLEQLILPRMLSDKPIELLTLSACQTAAGDERAGLGLAGVAVKSGARSALATLWSVSDEATEQLMSAFYGTLKQDETVSLAEALRRAQCDLLRNPRWNHPCFWSPYLLIGNWR